MPLSAALARLRWAGTAVLGGVTVLGVTAAGWPAGGPVAPGETRSQVAHAQALLSRARAMTHAVGELVPVPGARPAQAAEPAMAPLRHLRHADLMVVAPTSLRASTLSAIQHMRGIKAAVPVDAAKVKINGKFVAVLGVDPSAFRAFADKPTARNAALWRGVASGAVAVSYTMGRLDKLPAGSLLTVAGQQQESLTVGGVGTVGIAGVDAIVSESVAKSLGFPSHNAIVISAKNAGLKTRKALKALRARIASAVPHGAVVEPLVVPGAAARAGAPVTTTAATQASGGLVSPTQVLAMLRAAVSRVGMPYVWGAAGPRSFDCSGLTMMAWAAAGVYLPHLAQAQYFLTARVPLGRALPGDLIFYGTPSNVFHVGIYIGGGQMIDAPTTGETVHITSIYWADLLGAGRVQG
jgi:cell wall-associated NlpC family hydrolase